MPTPANFVYDEHNVPRMGTVRKSFQTNSLLLKPRLGAVKKPTQDLPEPNYIYGVCNDLEAEGVREVMTHREHIPDPDAINGPDLIQMNRLATIAWVLHSLFYSFPLFLMFLWLDVDVPLSATS
ncbi:hypothetical protein SELMODRAFT_404903 [Selaginella moellendorffii]|uniref:Uncharacterized protein n=1 Tax=Selaginella moellendorffii TaxID=88036 RepID=D8QXR4_SELML|nr:hypothetical protein SELMODRAFT_404903 [Selaginella moellendorffii]